MRATTMSEFREYVDQRLSDMFRERCDANTAKVAQLLADNSVRCDKCGALEIPCDGCAWAFPNDLLCQFSGGDPWICPNELGHFKPVGLLNVSDE